MVTRRLLGIITLAIAMAGCNFSRADKPAPTALPEAIMPGSPTPLPTEPPSSPPSFTPASTATLTPPPTATSLPSETPVILPTQILPTATVTLTATSAPTRVPGAQVCAACDQLRLRQSPGTAGQIQTNLAANTPLSIIGRTADNAWVQVVLNDGSNGWVASEYLTITIDLNVISVTGVAENTAAPPAVGSNVITGISSHAREIYLSGQANGNRANVFSTVGDSITYSSAFMRPLVSDVSLGDYGYLSPAYSFFSGPNARGENCYSASAIAHYPGWTTKDVLTPGKGNPGLCRGAETPLECEYRTAKPSVALIMLGTNDVAQNMPIATFQANLQRIVDISIASGVIPVLSTIPPFPVLEGRANAFNEVIVATARANDVPLWNYWLALQPLPDRGLSPDGVHPSEAPDGKDAYFDADHLQYGFTVRNLTALQMLYELWRQVLYDNDGGSATLPDGPPAAPPPTFTDPGPVDPATYSCPGAAPVQLAVGGQGRVTPGLPNKLRISPGLAYAQIGQIPGDAVFDVIGGPYCADGYTWWKARYGGQEGWTASGTGTDFWVEPYP